MMADGTHIEWTDATWNIITGCSVVSAGCKHCYAMKLAGTRLAHHASREGLTIATAAGPVWNGEVRFNGPWLLQPLDWSRPRRIFVCAHGDLFHEAVPDEWIDQVFAVMALAPQHTFQVLTKRAARMRSYLSDENVWPRIEVAARRIHLDLTGQQIAGKVLIGPLPHIWLGVSVEDQAAADTRIPDLMCTPAAIRWISAEPLLGKVDLRGWGAAAPLPVPEDAPSTWADYAWPEWVPQQQREQIESFWAESYGRGPKAWMRDNLQQRAPATGATVGLRLLKNWADVVPALSPEAEAHGRYIHRWNNIGTVLLEDGRLFYTGVGMGPGWLSKWLQHDDTYVHRLHWVVVGGESGPGARPMNPQWARDLRDQCATAGVPFLFKQWGNWVSVSEVEGAGVHHTFPDGRTVRHVGKKRAGRKLDGAEHNGFPGVRA
jgi:protein gp37